MFVSVVGGVQLMGFVGVFVGPMLAAVLVTLLKILKREMLARSRPPAGAQSPTP
jgi:predicted PurR-regulated permease PerM